MYLHLVSSWQFKLRAAIGCWGCKNVSRGGHNVTVLLDARSLRTTPLTLLADLPEICLDEQWAKDFVAEFVADLGRGPETLRMSYCHAPTSSTGPSSTTSRSQTRTSTAGSSSSTGRHLLQTGTCENPLYELEVQVVLEPGLSPAEYR